MNDDAGRSADRSNYSDDPETPTGIWVISVIGLFGAAIAVVGASLGIIRGGSLVLGMLVVGLGLLQAVTMLALVGLTPWAWYATIVLFTLGGVV